MQKPEDYKSTLSTCVIIQGPPGVGKTTLACMFPNPVIYDCDLNLKGPLKHLSTNNLPGIVGFNTIDIDEAGKEVLKSKRYKRLCECVKNDCKIPGVDTLVFDSMTKIAQYMLDDVMAQNNKEEMTIKLWGDYAHLWKHFINTLRMTGKYIVLIAHEEIEKDEHDGMFRHFIHMPGKNFKNEVGVHVTDIWRVDLSNKGTEETTRKVLTMPSNRYLLKNSMGLPATFPIEPKKVREYLATNGIIATPEKPK